MRHLSRAPPADLSPSWTPRFELRSYALRSYEHTVAVSRWQVVPPGDSRRIREAWGAVRERPRADEPDCRPISPEGRGPGAVGAAAVLSGHHQTDDGRGAPDASQAHRGRAGSAAGRL